MLESGIDPATVRFEVGIHNPLTPRVRVFGARVRVRVRVRGNGSYI